MPVPGTRVPVFELPLLNKVLVELSLAVAFNLRASSLLVGHNSHIRKLRFCIRQVARVDMVIFLNLCVLVEYVLAPPVEIRRVGVLQEIAKRLETRGASFKYYASETYLESAGTHERPVVSPILRLLPRC